jgi:hypothetical protein
MINEDYISDGITTLISYTLITNPDIFNTLNKILSIDSKILQQKLDTFFEQDIDPLDGYSIIYLCTLMYNNETMPNYICNILEKLEINISKSELQTNANNFINFIIKNKTIGGEKSNAFKNIFVILKQISLFLIAVVILYFEYTYFNQNLIPTLQETSITVNNYYNRLDTVLKELTSCQNMPVNPMASYIGKYGITKFDKLYQIANCLSLNRENNPVIDDMIRSRDAQHINKEKYTEMYPSFALVPIDYVFEENYPAKYKEDFKKDLDLVTNNEKMLPQIIQKTNELTVKVYEIIKKDVPSIDSRASLDTYMENIKGLSEMPASELERLLFPNTQEFEIKVDSNNNDESNFKSKLSSAFEFVTDTVKLGMNLINTAHSKGINVKAVNPFNAYIWTLQKYLKIEYRRLEDIKTKTERDFEDMRTEISRIIKNTLDLINYLPWLLFFNTIVTSILVHFSYVVYYKLYLNKNENREQPAIENNGFAIEDVPKGGKKRRTRKINKKSTNKYKKRNPVKTKKYKKHRYHHKKYSKKNKY